MAKKKPPAKRQKPLNGMADEFDVPEELQNSADSCNKSLLAKNRAAAKFKGAKETLIETMKRHKKKRVRVLKQGGGERILELDATDKINVKTVKRELEESAA